MTLVDKLERDIAAEQRRVAFLMGIVEAAANCIGRMARVKEARDVVDYGALAMVSAYLYNAQQVDFRKVDTNTFARLNMETLTKGFPESVIRDLSGVMEIFDRERSKE